MISRALTNLEWSDIQHLIETGRAEDDTIEFKRSFKGGDDYAALNEKLREQSLDALVREVLAFLNTRGGDVVIGIRESDGPTATAEEITTVSNPEDTADRVLRGLTAVIEPAQTSVAVRGVANPSDASRGVVVIRVRASVRAPHRSKRTQECFARRGSESVPMAMDEIQDLTLYRSRIRLEQLQLLERQFADFVRGRAENRDLGNHIFHIRTVVFPTTEQSIEITDQTLHALQNHNPVVYDNSGKAEQFSIVFRELYSRWKPVLRGRKQEDFNTCENPELKFATTKYAARVIKESGICSFDYAHLADLHGKSGIYSLWVVGYLAEICSELTELWEHAPSLLPATIRVGVRARGDVMVAYPADWRSELAQMPDEVFFLPDMVVETTADLEIFFRQAQIDFFSLLHLYLPDPYLLKAPEVPV